MDPTLFTPHLPEDQAVLAKICGIDLPLAYTFNGYQKGPRASGIRCSICDKLLGHESLVVAYKGVAHCKCYCEAVKVGMTVALRPALSSFGEDMERQLRRHDEQKGEHGWSRLTNARLWYLLGKEVEELHEALLCGKPEYIIHEAADVANIAMMIADNARATAGEKEGETNAP